MLINLRVGKCSLSLLGNQTADIDGVLLQSNFFVSAYCNVHDATSMTESRIKAWTTKKIEKSNRYTQAVHSATYQ